MDGRLCYAGLAVITLAGLVYALPASQVGASPGFQIIADRLKKAINASVDPCENFFEFACGGWKAANPVPPDATAHRGYLKTIYGLKRDHIKNELLKHFDQIDPTDKTIPRTVRQAKLLIDGCQANATAADWRTLVQLFDSYGGWPVLSHSWKRQDVETQQWTVDGLAGHISSHYYHPRGGTGIWSAVANYAFRIQRYELTVWPGTERDGGAPQFDKARFVSVAREIAAAAGLSVPDQQINRDADELKQVVVRLAAIYYDSNQSPGHINMTLADAQTRWPYVDWLTYFAKFAHDTLPMTAVQKFKVTRPNYFDKLAHYYPHIPARAAQNLLIYQIAVAAKCDVFNQRIPGEKASAGAGETSRQEDFRQLLPDGEPEVEAKDETVKQHCHELVRKKVRPATYVLFALFHAPHWNLALPEAHKIADGVLQSWQDMIQNTSWLHEAGKRVAKRKVRSVEFAEFGFDPKLFDDGFMNDLLAGLEFEAGNNGRVIAGLKFGRFIACQRLRKILPEPAHHFERTLTVNAFYSRGRNQISMPAAGMLTEPYFEYGYPKATNYGGFGFAVGHEMGHGFDPQGVHYGPHGEYSQWITPSYAAFHHMQTCIKDEYNNYCYTQDGQTKCIKGRSSAPDNSADNAGIVAAFRAYQQRIAQDGPEPSLPGEMSRYSMQQVFFMSFGYTWCRNTNKHWFSTGWEHAPHAPEDARVMVPDMNFEDFYKTFNCPVGSHMRPARPCRVWH